MGLGSERGDPEPMSYSQLRVKLVVAAGVVGALLLAATFVGCQTSPTSQAQSGPYGQYNGNQFAGAQNGQAPPAEGRRWLRRVQAMAGRRKVSKLS